ncbi:hypothetical protein C7E12_23210, partial [Stenotrophomonas maltophilia]
SPPAARPVRAQPLLAGDPIQRFPVRLRPGRQPRGRLVSPPAARPVRAQPLLAGDPIQRFPVRLRPGRQP